MLAVLAVASAVFVVSAKKPVYSVIGLLANFGFLALLFLTLSAEFLALVQIIIYSGAILMLFVFVIALLSSGVAPFSVGPNRLPRVLYPVAVFGFFALGGLLLVIIVTHPHIVQTAATTTSSAGPTGDAGVFGSVADFGKGLFTTYLLPFEATAFILMIAVIGVVSLAGDADPAPKPKRPARRSRKREPILREGRP